MYEQLLIQGGKVAFDLIKNSENAIKLGTPPFTNAIPNNASVEQMNGWKKSSIDLTRKTGSTLVAVGGKGGDPFLDINVYLTWHYGGKFNNKGSYIANATSYCKVNKCDKSISFDLSISFGSPFNAAESKNDVEAHLPFTVTAHIIQKRLSFKIYESIYVWRGEIGGEEGTDEKGNTVGWFSYEGEWMLKGS